MIHVGTKVLNLYVDEGDVEMAKSRGINLSELFRNSLAIELGVKQLAESKTTEEVIAELKNRNAHLTTELRETNTKLNKLTREYDSFKVKSANISNVRPSKRRSVM